MSLGTGGRADKRGNQYENWFLARLLLKIVEENLKSIVVEPLSCEESICEFCVTNLDGSKTYYQCKASNGTREFWSVSDFGKYDLFPRVRELLEHDRNASFKFVSPLGYGELNNVCRSAKNELKENFVKSLSNQKQRKILADLEDAFQLNSKNNDEYETLLNILSRCEFVQYLYNSEVIDDFESRLNYFFYGSSAGNVRILLQNYINDEGLYGKTISSTDINSFLRKNEVQRRIMSNDPRILVRIDALNKDFDDSYHPFQNRFFNRQVTKEILKNIEGGCSVIIHGEAGYGKSGCLRELSKYLRESGIPYLAISLDSNVQGACADKYGEALGLSQSPVYSLGFLANDKGGVLILDQLDSIRWNAVNAGSMLSVCREMLNQVNTYNNYNNPGICVVVCVRTFDLENDDEIQSLLENETNSKWNKVKVDSLSDAEMIQLIGEDYYSIQSNRLKEILCNPAALFIWSKLKQKNLSEEFSTFFDLIQKWWKQILDGYTKVEKDGLRLEYIIKKFIDGMHHSHSVILPSLLFSGFDNEIEYLNSCGLLTITNRGVKLSHQSYLDAFLLRGDLNAIYTEGKSLLETVLSWNSQLPSDRYRFTALLQTISKNNPGMFASQISSLLDSDKLHLYFKGAVFEVIGQLKAPSENVLLIVDQYLRQAEWKQILLHSVFEHHPPFVKHLFSTCSDKLSTDQIISLLISIKYEAPDLVVEIVNDLLTKKRVNIETACSVIGNDITKEADSIFKLRLRLYCQDNQLLEQLHFIDLEECLPNRAVQLFLVILSNQEVLKKPIYLHKPAEMLTKLIQCRSMIAELFEPVCSAGETLSVGLTQSLDYSERFWLPKEHEQSVARSIVNVLKDAIYRRIPSDPNYIFSLINIAANYKNAVSNELSLFILKNLPADFSDSVFEYVLSDFDNNIVDCLSNERDYLGTFKEVLKYHSRFCSDDVFKQLESTIVQWHDDPLIVRHEYRQRFEMKNKWNHIVYYPAWGHLQKALLPYLDNSRTSDSTKQLICVLNRNAYVLSDRYHAGFSLGEGGIVTSSIHDHAEQLSDRSWLEIMRSNLAVDSFSCGFRESSHMMFARDLELCAAKNPERFAKLIYKMPDDAFSGYYEAIMRGIAKADASLYSFQRLCNVIGYVIKLDKKSFAKSILWTVDEKNKETWPHEIICYVRDIATGKIELEDDRAISDKKHFLENYLTEILNDAQSLAITVTGKQISKNNWLAEAFKKDAEKLCVDQRRTVIFAMCQCAAGYYAIDPEYSYNLLDRLVIKDPYVLFDRYAFWLAQKNISLLATRYFEALMILDIQKDNYVNKMVGKRICVIAILTKRDAVIQYLFTSDWSTETINEICSEAIEAFPYIEYRDMSMNILEHFIHVNGKQIEVMGNIFKDGYINLETDLSFVSEIISKTDSKKTVYAFAEYLKLQTISIKNTYHYLKLLASSLNYDTYEWEYRNVKEVLRQLIIQLLDYCREDERYRELCVDLLDEFYEKMLSVNIDVSDQHLVTNLSNAEAE